MRITRPTSLIALAIATLGTGVAIAQTPPPRPDRTAPTTRAEAQSRAEAMFARMDVNRDGRLTPEDRAAGETARHSETFASVDTNSDGNISRAEWDAHHATGHGAGGRHGGPGGDEMAQGGRGEGRGMRGRRGGRGGRGGDMMMRRADTNNDQAVDRAEFVASALQRFDRGDANRDGTLTAAERDAARAEMRGRGRGRGPMGDGDMPPPPPPAN